MFPLLLLYIFPSALFFYSQLRCSAAVSSFCLDSAVQVNRFPDLVGILTDESRYRSQVAKSKNSNFSSAFMMVSQSHP
jgi:hypothetical protein